MIQKRRMKEYADTKHKATASKLLVGDLVLLKQRKRNKLSTNFELKPYIITKRKGNMVIIERNGKSYMRNVTFVKKVPSNAYVTGGQECWRHHK